MSSRGTSKGGKKRGKTKRGKASSVEALPDSSASTNVEGEKKERRITTHTPIRRAKGSQVRKQAGSVTVKNESCYNGGECSPASRKHYGQKKSDCRSQEGRREKALFQKATSNAVEQRGDNGWYMNSSMMARSKKSKIRGRHGEGNTAGHVRREWEI